MTGPHPDPDWKIRKAAFKAVDRMVARHGPILPWRVIAEGFQIGSRRFLAANKAKGIFWPGGMAGVLSIKGIVADARKGRRQPYEDTPSSYHFRRGDPDGKDNARLRQAQEQGTPLIYFYGVEPGYYRPLWPVFIRNIRAIESGFVVDLVVDEPETISFDLPVVADARDKEIRRRYVTVETTKRLHQEEFRFRVLRAYGNRCAVCRLPWPELIEAAHIIPDREEESRASVQNGLALCRLHHGAYDANLMGIRADRVIELAPKVLRLRDGEPVQHALSAFHGCSIVVPQREQEQPRPEWLEWRYKLFRKAG